MKQTCLRRAQSCAVDAREAARESHAAVAQADMALVVFFCSSAHDLGALAGEMRRLFTGIQVVGCTTAGEIGPAGYREHSLSGASFCASRFSAVSGCIDRLQQFKIAACQPVAQELLQRLERQAPQADAGNSFALLLIDGLPAAREYARILGVDARDLNPMRFAACPLVVMIDGTNYVRSIRKVNPDGSLTFFCAIEEGLVLRVAKGVDLLENLTQAFAQVRAEIGPPQLVLGCDCILRKLEIVQSHLMDRVGEVLMQNQVVGFNTYGEQFHGVHVNQTFVGIAIGSDAPEADGD